MFPRQSTNYYPCVLSDFTKQLSSHLAMPECLMFSPGKRGLVRLPGGGRIGYGVGLQTMALEMEDDIEVPMLGRGHVIRAVGVGA